MGRSNIGYDYDLVAGRIRDSPLGGTFLDSVNTAAVALMATMAMKLGRTSLVDR
jgi:chromate transport protein ChrA